MKLIVSLDRDHSTDEVIDWLTYAGCDFDRINVTRDVEELPVHFQIGNPADETSAKVGWVRKTGFFRDLGAYSSFRTAESFDLLSYLYFELNSAKRHYYINKEIEWITGIPNGSTTAKTDLLCAAQALGIKIPQTHIINNKKALLEIMEMYGGEVITKPITDVPSFEKDGHTFIPLTRMIKKEDLAKIPEMFFPSLVQQMIRKRFEIRSFYLNGEFRSAAIFSQSDDTTLVDFRNYNFKKPNRIVPYSLPVDMENKLRKLFEQNKIATGSADIIYGVDGDYYFLEINETGQFGMISKPANLHIEKLIAETLIKHSEKYGAQ